MIKRREVLAIGAFLASATSLRAATSWPLAPADIEHSQVSLGNAARFRRAFARAERGETIRLGFIGGSITTGAIASLPSNGYPELVSDWWRRTFPKARVEVVNAAIGATGSLYGSLRVGQELLFDRLDAVIVEFSVNDGWMDQEPFESLLRHILSTSPDIAVMLMFMTYDSGNNEQKWQQEIGAHYALPMVSFRDAVWPEIQNGRLKTSDILVDIVHPNDLGHRIAADLITAELGKLRETDAGTSDAALPSPLYGARFENAHWLGAKKLKLKKKRNWVLTDAGYPQPHSLGPDIWLTEPDTESPLSLDWKGTGLVAVMMLANDDPNPVTLEIDGKVAQAITLETVPRRNVVIVELDLPRGKHTFSIRRKLVSDMRPPFGLFGIGIVP